MVKNIYLHIQILVGLGHVNFVWPNLSCIHSIKCPLTWSTSVAAPAAWTPTQYHASSLQSCYYFLCDENQFQIFNPKTLLFWLLPLKLRLIEVLEKESLIPIELEIETPNHPHLLL